MWFLVRRRKFQLGKEKAIRSESCYRCEGDEPLDEVAAEVASRLSDDLQADIVPGEKAISTSLAKPCDTTHQGWRGTLARSYMSSSGLLSVWKSSTRGLA